MEYGLKSQTSACGAYDGLPATQPHHRLTTTLLAHDSWGSILHACGSIRARCGQGG